MHNIIVTLPDNSVKEVPKGTNSQEIASMIGERLSNSVVVSKINGVLSDLNKPINEDCTLELLTGQSPEGHETLLHSTAHLMAQAVKELFPDAKISIGPTIEKGFYYDFELEDFISENDLRVIEKKMMELARSNQEIIRKEVSAKQALKIFKDKKENYKLEIINQINPEDIISLYTQTNFTDLCRGPHVSNTSKIKYFKLLSTSGAYWRGDEKNQMLQRI
jgi:Threonyl-tRNA synthetase